MNLSHRQENPRRLLNLMLNILDPRYPINADTGKFRHQLNLSNSAHQPSSLK